MSTTFYADKGNAGGVQSLQVFTVPEGNQPVACTVQDVGMTTHLAYPKVGAQMIPQHPAYGQHGEEAFHYFAETVIRCIEDQETRVVIAGEFGGKAAADTAAIHDHVVFGILFFQRIVNELHVAEHVFFTALAGAFAESAVIYQHHIIIVPVEITGIFGPAFYAAGVAMKIKDKPMRRFTEKVKTVYTYTGFHIKEIFAEWDIIHETEILFKPFGLEYKTFLQEVSSNRQYGDAADDIPDYIGQVGQLVA